MKKLDFKTIEKSYEVLIEDCYCWQFEHANILNCFGSKDVILSILEMSYYKWKLLSDLYPMILLENNLITKKCDFIQDMAFFPNLDYSEHSECYIEDMPLDTIIKVIIDSKSIIEPDFNLCKSKQIKKFDQKTYLMVDGNGYVKIGKSYDPEVRERTLQSQKPTINLIAVLDLDIEKDLHKAFSEKRVRGEWFLFSKKEVIKIISEYNFVKSDEFNRLIFPINKN